MTRLPLIALVLFGLHASAASQTLAIHGGLQIELVMDPVYAPTASNGSARISWNKASTRSKLIVSTFAPGQRYDLSVEAENAKRAISTGEVQLSDGAPAMDFLRDVEARRAGHADLRYRTQVTANESTGQDVHTITYTLTVQ